MHWPPFEEWFVQFIGMASNCLLGLGAFVTAGAAIAALTTWRKELRGKAQFELARRIVFLAHQYQEAFLKAQRAPLEPSEWAGRVHQMDEDRWPELTRIRNEQFAHGQRVMGLRHPLTQLEQAGWDMTLVIGEDETSLLAPFDEAWRSLRQATDIYFDEMTLRIQHPEARFAMLDDSALRSHAHILRGIGDDQASQLIGAGIKTLEQRFVMLTSGPRDHKSNSSWLAFSSLLPLISSRVRRRLTALLKPPPPAS